MNDSNKLHKAGDVLKEVFKRIVPENVDDYSRFFSGWAKIAGEETAFHVRPKDIVNKTLILESDHPGWSQRIKMREEGLLKVIHSKYPELDIIRLRVLIDRGQPEPVHTRSNSEKPSQNLIKAQDIDNISSGEDEAFFALLDKFRRNADS